MSEYDADVRPLGRKLTTTWPIVVSSHVPKDMIYVVFDPARCEHVAMVHPTHKDAHGIRR